MEVANDGTELSKTTEVKSRIISKVDNELSHYEDEKNNTVFSADNIKRSYEISGAIHALNRLRIQVDAIDTKDYSIIPKVKERDTPYIRPPASFLNHVLLEIKCTLEDKIIDGSPGSGANPDAVPGREEALLKIEEFISELDDQFKNSEFTRIIDGVLHAVSTPELTLTLSKNVSDDYNVQIYVKSPDEVSEEETLRQFQDLNFMDKLLSAFKVEHPDANIIQIDGRDAIRIPAWEKSLQLSIPCFTLF